MVFLFLLTTSNRSGLRKGCLARSPISPFDHTKNDYSKLSAKPLLDRLFNFNGLKELKFSLEVID